jgi:HD-GYP domain-containing protein (c-di-GMP phosphodiesterase class II)
MTSKQQVLIGLAATALLTSLAISEFLPGWIISIILLLVGVSFTCLLVLKQKRKEQIEDLGMLLEACKGIGSEQSIEKVMAELSRNAGLLTKAEYSHAYLLDANNDLRQIPGGHENEALLSLPIKKDNQEIGILLLGDKKGKETFNKHDREMAEMISYFAGRAMANLIQQQESSQIFTTTLKSIARAIEAREEGFDGHAERVAAISVLAGKKLSLPEDELKALEYSAILHDIGKLAVLQQELPAENIPDDEDLRPDQHPVLGADFFPENKFFIPIKEAIRYHHERYNGTGYPEGREKNDIPFLARIIAVADFYDALTKLCSEEERLDHYHTMRVIRKATGTLFDPLVVVALEEVEEEIKAIDLS